MPDAQRRLDEHDLVARSAFSEIARASDSASVRPLLEEIAPPRVTLARSRLELGLDARLVRDEAGAATLAVAVPDPLERRSLDALDSLRDGRLTLAYVRRRTTRTTAVRVSFLVEPRLLAADGPTT